MKILLLGATGFIGGAIARRLLESGDDVNVLVRSEEAAVAWDAQGAMVYRGDLGDPESIARAAENADRIVHAAGIFSPRAATRALRWTHVAGTENVLNACRFAKVKRLVYIGCADVTLANVDRVHWDERRSSGQPPYGERAKSLALAEELALSASGPELEVVCLRPAWVWGPGDTSRLPHLCREAIAQKGLRLVGQGETFLATIYIENLVDAVLAALSTPDAVGHTFYLADPEFLHAREFFAMLSEAIGVPRPRSGLPMWLVWPWTVLASAGPGGLSPVEVLQRARSTLFDVNAAIGKLAFEPSIKTEDGMRFLSEWMKEKGGAETIARLVKPPPDATSVDAQVNAAGGD